MHRCKDTINWLAGRKYIQATLHEKALERLMKIMCSATRAGAVGQLWFIHNVISVSASFMICPIHFARKPGAGPKQ